MLRCFENDNITHVDGSIDPVRDKGIIDTELQLKDLETIENRLAKTQKQAVVAGTSRPNVPWRSCCSTRPSWSRV